MKNMNMNLKGILGSIVLTGAFVAPAMASGVGTTGAAFLKVGPGARALGMAGAVAATARGSDAIYWNPAGLSGITSRDVSASYNLLYEDQNQGYLSGAMPTKAGAEAGGFGLGVNYLTVGDIEKRAGDTELADSTFNNTNLAVSFAYGRPLSAMEGVSLGGGLKFISTKLDSQSDTAFAVDLGAQWKQDAYGAGVVIQNLGSKLGPDSLPLGVKLGGSWQASDQLLLALDGDFFISDKRYVASLGAEYWFLEKVFAVRAGYQLGRGADKLGGASGLGTGIGLAYSGFRFDYAFVPFGDLGDSHRISLGYRF